MCYNTLCGACKSRLSREKCTVIAMTAEETVKPPRLPAYRQEVFSMCAHACSGKGALHALRHVISVPTVFPLPFLLSFLLFLGFSITAPPAEATDYDRERRGITRASGISSRKTSSTRPPDERRTSGSILRAIPSG